MWDIDYSLIEDWLATLDDKTVAHIFAAFEVLEANGPTLGRPLVDTLEGSKCNNMKELRPASSGTTVVRILFAFDPARKAIMLLGGDKSKGQNNKKKWSGWYKEAIPQAEKSYEQHLRSIGEYDGRS